MWILVLLFPLCPSCVFGHHSPCGMGFASRSSATWGRFQTPPVCKCEKPIAASKLTVCSYPQSHHAFVRVALLVFVLVDFCGRESSSFSAPWHHLCCAGFLGNANSAIKMPRIMTALHLIQRCRKCAAPSAVHYFSFSPRGFSLFGFIFVLIRSVNTVFHAPSFAFIHGRNLMQL